MNDDVGVEVKESAGARVVCGVICGCFKRGFDAKETATTGPPAGPGGAAVVETALAAVYA